MKNRCVSLGSSLLLTVTIAFGPAVQSADQGVIHLAAAIGEETSPKPKQPTKPTTPAKTAPATTQPPVAATKPAATPEPAPTGMATSTKVWIGVGVAAAGFVAGGAGAVFDTAPINVQ
jgi:hypothetical protein